jgi:hypothetical protein
MMGAWLMLGFLDRLRQHGATVMPLELAGPSQVRAYWEALRQENALPRRAALDPRGLTGALDRVFLAERIGRGLAQVRLAGSALTDLAGTELRGLPLSCLFSPESRPLLAQALEEAFTSPAIVEIDLGSDRGRTGLAIARLVLLPLQDEGDCRQLLGVFGLAEGHVAGKLQILGRRSERLTVPEPQPTPVTEVAPQPVPERRHGHLRLVHFNAE